MLAEIVDNFFEVNSASMRFVQKLLAPSQFSRSEYPLADPVGRVIGLLYDTHQHIEERLFR